MIFNKILKDVQNAYVWGVKKSGVVNDDARLARQFTTIIIHKAFSG